MNENSRMLKSIRNVSFGMLFQVITIILRFVARTIFIKILGEELLGINGLFTNILAVLSLAELGFGQAIIYNLYEPLKKKNNDRVAALMNFYKKIYDITALIVLCVGVIIIPFLKFIVNTTLDMSMVTKYYLLFLMSSVISYLFSYKSAILNADEKQFIQNIYSIIEAIVLFVLQTIILIWTKNYILYLTIQIIINLINNIVVASKVNKMYPFINSNNSKLEKDETKKIYSDVSALFIYKFSGTILNNTDNILISMLINTVVVGYYSNYLMVISAVNTFLTIIFNSLTGSLGHYNVEKNSEDKYRLYEVLIMIAGYMYSVCSIILLFVTNDFVQLWIGEEYLLDIPTLLVIVLNFFVPGMLISSWIFRNTTGTFKETKYLSLITATINLVLSIVLGLKLELLGILLATLIARLLTNYWYEPFVLYKKIFKRNFKYYLKRQMEILLVNILICLILSVIFREFITISWLNIILKIILSSIITTIVYVVTFKRTSEFKEIIERIKFILNGKLSKKS